MTSIKWFVEQLMEHLKEQHNITIDLKNTYAFEKSEEMHKQEIVNTFKHAQALMVLDPTKRAEQHYYELYEKDKQ